MRNKIYTTTLPKFYKTQISEILKETRKMLSGEYMLSMGENVREFEREFAQYIGRKCAIATNSATSALEVVFKEMDLKNKSVIVPTQTFFANASSVINAGGTLVLGDCDGDFALDVRWVERNLSSDIRAVVVVHFAGVISREIFTLRDLCCKQGILLIEDCSHAHGAYALDSKGRRHMAGSIGDVGIFSFFSTKVLTTGEGGMIVCDDSALADRYKAYRNRGMNPHMNGEYFSVMGSNMRLNEFAAILGRNSLRYLERNLTHRNNIASIYTASLVREIESGAVRIQSVPRGWRHAYWRYLLYVSGVDSETLIVALRDRGINTDAPYKPLLHAQPLLAHLDYTYPVCDVLAKTHISLPMHLGITKSDARYIAKTFREILKEVANG